MYLKILEGIVTNVEASDARTLFEGKRPDSTVGDKEALREEIAERIQAMPEDERAREAEAIRRRLEDLPAFRVADAVLVYVSLADEVPTRELIQDLLSQGREVCVPRSVGETIDAVPIDALEELVPGPDGVPAPPEHRPFDPRMLDLAVVPGRAFDHDRNRLGRGGGRFDRFLADFHPLSVGLAFECQIVDRVPVEDHDEPVDLVVHPWGLEGEGPA